MTTIDPLKLTDELVLMYAEREYRNPDAQERVWDGKRGPDIAPGKTLTRSDSYRMYRTRGHEDSTVRETRTGDVFENRIDYADMLMHGMSPTWDQPWTAVVIDYCTVCGAALPGEAKTGTRRRYCGDGCKNKARRALERARTRVRKHPPEQPVTRIDTVRLSGIGTLKTSPPEWVREITRFVKEFRAGHGGRSPQEFEIRPFLRSITDQTEPVRERTSSLDAFADYKARMQWSAQHPTFCSRGVSVNPAVPPDGPVSDHVHIAPYPRRPTWKEIERLNTKQWRISLS